MYHARISIFKNRRSNERKKKKRKKKQKEDTAEGGDKKRIEGDDEEEADTWRSDVAKRDLERPGNERLVFPAATYSTK